MDFSLNDEQRPWQTTARKSRTRRCVRTRSSATRSRGRSSVGLGHRREGLEAGLPHARRAQGIGRQGTDYVSQALVMAELARGDSAMSKDLQPELEVEPSHRGRLQRRAEGTLSPAVRRRSPLPARQRHHRAQRRLRQPHAAEGRRPRPATGCAPSARATSGFSTARNASSPTAGRSSCSSWMPAATRMSVRARAARMFMVPTRHAGLPHRQGVQQERLAVLPERRDDFRECARAARQRRRRRRHRDMKTGKRRSTGGDIFGDLELAANALGVCDDACEQAMSSRRRTSTPARPDGPAAWSSSRSTR